MTSKMKQIRYKMEEIWLQSLVIVPLEIEFRRYSFVNRKERQLQQRRRIKKLLLVWGILGMIGFVWLVHAMISWLIGLFQGAPEQTPTSGEYLEPVWTQEALQDREEQGTAQKVDKNTGTSDSGFIYVEPEKIVRREECLELYEASKELLVLVNREHALEEGAYEDSLRSICNGRLQASDYLYDDLVDLLAAADEAGYQYWIASAYRSRERQQELVDEDVARHMAQGMNRQQALEKTYKQTMPAGKSEHETGLALDILCSENLNMDVTQAEEPGNKWLAEHAWEYGFILRYPADKEAVTGILYEPWHFRYVGKAAAAFLWENDLTLEEFWEVLGSKTR